MALTAFQRRLCRLLADARIASGRELCNRGVALNELTGASRISRDIDLSHDTETAVDTAWHADRALLKSHGFDVQMLRQRTEVTGQNDRVRMEWARDSGVQIFSAGDLRRSVTHPAPG